MASPFLIALVAVLAALLVIYLFTAKEEIPYLRYNEMMKETGVIKFGAQAAMAIAPILPKSLLRQKPTARARLADKINKAGNPWKVTPIEFLVLKYAFLILGIIMGFVLYAFIGGTLTILQWYMWPILGGAAGFIFPNYKYSQETKKRDLQFKKELPEALDLLVIATSTGSGFKEALAKVVPLLKPGTVQDELARVNQDIAGGNTITGALNNLSQRCPNVDTEAFIKAVKQSEEYGSNADISNTLRARAKTNREEYNSFVESKIAKLPTQMSAGFAATMPVALLIIALSPMLSMLTSLGLF